MAASTATSSPAGSSTSALGAQLANTTALAPIPPKRRKSRRLNFFFSSSYIPKIIKEILDKKENFGKSNKYKGKKTNRYYESIKSAYLDALDIFSEHKNMLVDIEKLIELHKRIVALNFFISSLSN